VPRTFDGISNRILPIVRRGTNSAEDEERWIDEQGPYCPQFIEWLTANKGDYDVIIFVTYLYWLTVRGMELVKEKAILIPTAHDEPPIYLKVYDKIFAAPRAIAYNTVEERAFIYRRFHNKYIRGDVFGVGVDLPENYSAKAFKEKYRLDNYLIFAGRIDESKGCGEMFEHFTRYKQRNPSDLRLALLGKKEMALPQNPEIISLGFVSDEDKFSGIAGARALILPSKFESLSIVVLEALALGVPVIVNGQCEVLRGHCVRSNAGLYYTNYAEFEGTVNYLLTHRREYEQMSENGKQYIAANYDWQVIINKFHQMISMVAGSGNR
jgi:glycosyltransferase involved in cell wall biosynthesis